MSCLDQPPILLLGKEGSEPEMLYCCCLRTNELLTWEKAQVCPIGVRVRVVDVGEGPSMSHVLCEVHLDLNYEICDMLSGF